MQSVQSKPQKSNFSPDLSPNNALNLAGLRIQFVTFGCQMNKYDSERTADLLAECGAVMVGEKEKCDWVVFNTCSVRDQAENRLQSYLGAARDDALDGNIKIAVMGCVAQTESVKLRKRFPYVSIFAGTRMFPKIPRLISKIEAGETDFIMETGTDCDVTFGSVTARRDRPRSAFLTISRGCDKRCTYCVVPYTRGDEISRRPDEIIAEAEKLAEAGVVEITLLGQTIDTYGRDLAQKESLSGLLKDIYKVPGLKRIRFITSHPEECDEELFQVMHDLGDKVMPHIHMPAQSGSNAVLRRMARGYTRERYLEIVAAAKRKCPELEITGDWIVGFCGETGKDFEQSVSLMKEVQFQGSYCFKYSPRPVAPAINWEDDIPEKIKHERLQRLLRTQESISLAKNKACIGKSMEVITEGPSKNDPGRLTGRTKTNKLLHFDDEIQNGIVPAQPGDSILVEVSEATPFCILGKRAR